jgi:hypothetical protein
MSRERAALDLGEFAPKPSSVPRESISIAREIGEQAGFTARHGETGETSRSASPPPRIDGRTLRRTARTDNLNISVEPAVRDEFWTLASEGGFGAGGEFLKELLQLYRSRR